MPKQNLGQQNENMKDSIQLQKQKNITPKMVIQEFILLLLEQAKMVGCKVWLGCLMGKLLVSFQWEVVINPVCGIIGWKM